MKLALFDLDKTLLPIDSDHAWGDYCVAKGWIADNADYKKINDAFYADYLAGCLDIAAYTRFACEVLQKYDNAQLAAMHAEFMQVCIQPMISQVARDLVARYQNQPDWQVVVITATNEFVTRPIVAEFGVENIIATELLREADGGWTNEIRGIPSLREGKVSRVLQWLAARGYGWDDVKTSVMYSDSMNDLPLLEHAHEAIATNPDPALRALAKERGWEILDLYPVH